MKTVANEIFGVFEKYKNGQCTYDRALEDASNIMNKYADERPIVGYIKSKTLRSVLYDIFSCKKQNKEKSYIFDCEIHQNNMRLIEEMHESIIQHNKI
jgi:hypothetical protein